MTDSKAKFPKTFTERDMRFLARVIFTIGLSLVAFSGKLYVWPTGGDTATGEAFNLKEKADGMAVQIRDFMDSRKTPRDFLPAAPDGWTRRAFVRDDRTRMAGFAGVEEDMPGHSRVTGTKAGGWQVDDAGKALARQKARTTWMYEKDNLLVEMTAIRPKPVEGLTLRNNAMRMVRANNRAFQAEEPFGVVQGVVWKKLVARATPVPGAEAVDWTLAAQFGDIQLYARGLGTSESEMRGFLDAVDYDGLNRTLDRSLSGVGSTAPQLTREQELAQARAEIDQQRHGSAEAMKLAEQNVQLEVTDAPPGSQDSLADAGVQSAAAAPVPEIKVNRFGGKKKRKSSCGGTSFCSVGGK